MKQHENVELALTRLCAELAHRGIPKLPAERELAERFGVSRYSLRRALDGLEAQHVVRRERGRGGGAFLTGVTPQPAVPGSTPEVGDGPKIMFNLSRITPVHSLLASQGMSSGTRVVATETVTDAPEAARILCGSENEPVHSILRMRFADGDTFAFEHLYVSAKRFPSLLGQGLEQSFYLLAESEYDVRIGRSEEVVEVSLAPHNVAEVFGIPEGAPVIKLTRTSWDTDGDPVEYSIDLLRADRTRLVATAEDPKDRFSAQVRPA